jgi:hypothetical protein
MVRRHVAGVRNTNCFVFSGHLAEIGCVLGCVLGKRERPKPQRFGTEMNARKRDSRPLDRHPYAPRAGGRPHAAVRSPAAPRGGGGRTTRRLSQSTLLSPPGSGSPRRSVSRIPFRSCQPRSAVDPPAPVLGSREPTPPTSPYTSLRMTGDDQRALLEDEILQFRMKTSWVQRGPSTAAARR